MDRSERAGTELRNEAQKIVKALTGLRREPGMVGADGALYPDSEGEPKASGFAEFSSTGNDGAHCKSDKPLYRYGDRQKATRTTICGSRTAKSWIAPSVPLHPPKARLASLEFPE